MYPITDLRGQSIMLFSQAQRDAYITNHGKSPASFSTLPDWVRAVVADKTSLPDEKLYAFLTMMQAADTDNDGEADIWRSRFAPPSQRLPKPGFLEIFTNSMGELTGEEIREQFELYGYPRPASGPIKAKYNDKLATDAALYGEDLDNQEIRERIGAEAYERFLRVDEGISKVIHARPVYFSFEADYASDGPSVNIDGIRIVQNLEVTKGMSIGIALPGKYCNVRDTFVEGPGKDALKPGRDRWYRTTGSRVFDAMLMSPILMLSRVQLKQGQQGIDMTFDQSPILRPEMFVWS